MFVNGSELNEHIYRGPSKDASYQVLIHLARRFWLISKKIFSSETAFPNKLKFGRKHV
jgi:hypothetical protein